MPAPSTASPQNPPVKSAGNGTIYTGGFGIINAYSTAGTYCNTAAAPLPCGFCLQGRTGMLIARFQF